MKKVLTLILLAVSAAAAQAAPDGALLYSRHCAACHGEDGHGGVGVPLALPSFLEGASDHYLSTTIRQGRPGRVMPAFTELSEGEIKALVSHLRNWSPTPAVSDDPSPVNGDPRHGQALYGQHCASCHGADGEGGAGTGVTFSRPRELPIIAPALNNPGFLAAASDQMIKRTLMEGRAGTPMVSFRAQGLSEQDINDVVSYLRSFAERPAASEPLENEDAALVYESPYSLADTVANIKRAALGKNFRIIREQYLNQGLAEKGAEDTQQVIIYFCNFQFLNDALAVDPRVGLFLPCRVTALEKDGQVLVMTVNPLRLSLLFNNTELTRMCKNMYQLYEEILEEATL